MRQSQVPIITNGDMSQATVASIGIDVEQIFLGSIQAVWTGTPVGNFTVEVSNDIVQPGLNNPSQFVVNWTTYTGSTQAAGGAAGNWVWDISNVGYKWIRLLYTKGSSTGVLRAVWFGKGA